MSIKDCIVDLTHPDRIGMRIYTPEYRELIRQDYPDGDFCSRCSKKNDFWDDLGWFYSSGALFGYEGVVCKDCWHELGCYTGDR